MPEVAGDVLNQCFTFSNMVLLADIVLLKQGSSQVKLFRTPNIKEPKDKSTLTVLPPDWRWDITN